MDSPLNNYARLREDYEKEFGLKFYNVPGPARREILEQLRVRTPYEQVKEDFFNKVRSGEFDEEEVGVPVRKAEIIKQLVAVANELDVMGMYKEAEDLDKVVRGVEEKELVELEKKAGVIDTLDFDVLKRIGGRLVEDKYISQEKYKEALDEINKGNSPELFEVTESGDVYIHTGGAYPMILKGYALENSDVKIF